MKVNFSKLVDTPEVLLRLKDQFLQSLLVASSILGLVFVLVTAAIVTAPGEIGTLCAAVVLYLPILLVTFQKKWPYALRSRVFTAALLLASSLLLLRNGLGGGGQMAFFFTVILSLSLMGIREGALVSAAAAVLIAAVGMGLSGGHTLPWLTVPANAGDAADWLAAALFFWLFMQLVLLVFILIFQNIQNNLSVRLYEARELEQERMGLEWQVSQRTHVLQAEIVERKKIENALRESELKYRSLLSQLPVGVYRTTLEGKILHANPALAAMLGFELVEDLVDYAAIDSFYDQAEERNIIMEKLRQEKGVFSIEVKLRRRDGIAVWVKNTGRAIMDSSGQVVYIDGTMEDISERVQMQKLEKALYHIAETANNTENLLELYQAVHAIISDLIPAHNFFIALYDASDETLEFPYYVDEYDTKPLGRYKLSNGLTDYVIRTGKPLLAYPQEKQKLKEIGDVKPLGTDSVDWVGVPLITATNRVMGALVVQTYTQGQRYSHADIDILSFVSTQIAMAIERKQSDERLKYLGTHDVLTGLFNRNFFETEIERLQNSRQFPISILVADVDYLKEINDSQGHIAGDNLLKQVAVLFKDAFRSEDIISRIGGDEFAVLLPRTDQITAAAIVARLRKMMESGNNGQYAFPLYVSIGMSTAEGECLLSDILKQADDRMYLDKMGKRKNKKAGQLVSDMG